MFDEEQGLKKIHPDMIKVWRLDRLIWLAVFALLLVVIVIVTLVFDLPGTMAGGCIGACVGICIMFIISFTIGTKIEYRQWGYALGEEKVEIHHGIFFRRHTVVPVIRIQHIEMSQGPIYRRFNLYKVEICLASGDVEIIGLNKEEAQYICDTLNCRLTEKVKAEAENAEEEKLND